MNDQTTWKILFFLCGDASGRLASDQDQVDLETLLAPLAFPAGPGDAVVLAQAHLAGARQAVRLAQLPGDAAATRVATLDGTADSPAARDAFVAWALRAYPTSQALLVLRDCQVASAGAAAASGSVFSIMGPADAPEFWPLSEAALGELADRLATRGLGAWLASLASSLAGRLTGVRPTPRPKKPATPKETPPMPSLRDWTILLYMAGDNGATFQSKYGKFSLMAEMTGAGIQDLEEAEKVGTTDQVAVLAQFDTLPAKDTLAKDLMADPGGTYRLEVHQGRSVIDNIVQAMPDTNSGDPAELAKFIVWGMNRCPARRTMLVLWNHGLGWKDEDIYAKVRGLSRSAAQGHPPRAHNIAMFRSTARSINRRASHTQDDRTRAILCDDTSMDFLTNVEMSQALRVAEFAADEADVTAIFEDKDRLKELMRWGNEGARRHLNIIGMDACLMAMIEVQYQVRHFADVMVASQEVEPMKGWPYTSILADLAARPSMDARELSGLIVDRFVESYLADTRRQPDVTQSAIDLSRLGEAAGLIETFARSLAREFHGDIFLETAYKRARDNANTAGYAFEDLEYVDLVSLLDVIDKQYSGDRGGSKTLEAAAALKDWLASPSSPVIRNGVSGKFEGKAHGISIYVPRGQPSPLYKDLDFHSAGWYAAIKKIHGA